MFQYLMDNGISLSTFYTTGERKIDKSVYSFLQGLANDNLMDIKAYLKKCQKCVGLNRKIPLYFNDKLFLIALKCEGKIYYLNYFSLKVIGESFSDIYFVFQDNSLLCLKISKKIVLNQLRQVELILAYLRSKRGLMVAHS